MKIIRIDISRSPFGSYSEKDVAAHGMKALSNYRQWPDTGEIFVKVAEVSDELPDHMSVAPLSSLPKDIVSLIRNTQGHEPS